MIIENNGVRSSIVNQTLLAFEYKQNRELDKLKERIKAVLVDDLETNF